MSTSYWLNAGIGIRADDVYDKLNKRKLVNMLAVQLPKDETVQFFKRSSNLSEFDIEEFLYGEPFQNLGDLLTYFDDTDTLTYGDNGDGESYFFYPPCMPWEVGTNDPKSAEEVHQRIIAAVMKATDMTAEEIEELINDDLYEVGYG